MNTDQKKVKSSILVQMMMMSLIPLVAGLLAVMIIAVSALTAGIRDESLRGLSDMAQAVAHVYDNMAPGDWHLEDGTLYKGALNLSEVRVLDDFVQESDVEMTLFYGDTRYVTTLKGADGASVIGTQASPEIAAAVLNNGEEYEAFDAVVLGEKYFAHYTPLKNGNETVGMLFAGKPRADMYRFIKSRLVRLTLPAAVILAAAVLICIFCSTRIARGIREAENVVEIIAGGDLTQSVSGQLLARKDEVGSIARATENLRGNLLNIVSEIIKSAEVLTLSGTALSDIANQTASSTGEIVTAVEGISKGAVTQAEAIETANRQMSDMGQEIDNIASSVDRLDATSADMEAAGNASGKIIAELAASNNRTIEAVAHIGEQVVATNEAAEKIKIAINAITEIAEQTNLLSLNASIEAARAGEQGKGFAVVATEISKLASESAESAQLINDIVDKLNKESEKSIEAMSSMREIIGVQVEKLDETTMRFAKVTDGINISRGETADIKEKVASCDSSKGVIVDAMANLSSISEENAASAEETNTSMEELESTIAMLMGEAGRIGQLANELEAKVGQFKVR